MVNVHDIVRFQDRSVITFYETVPDWLYTRPASQHYAVARRMKTTASTVAIGIRGKERSERIAGFINEQDIEQVITPKSLVRNLAQYRDSPFYPFLSEVDTIIAPFRLEWGPTGSIGFELATGIPVATEKSDLDMTVYVPPDLDYQLLEQLYEELQQCSFRIDVQIEFEDAGAALLPDIIKFKNGFLLRTSSGLLMASIINGQVRIKA